MMETEYQFIVFARLADKPKTQVWSCRNRRSNDELGQVRWYGPWRQYCFFPRGEVVFNNGCLANIQHFILQLNMPDDESKVRK